MVGRRNRHPSILVAVDLRKAFDTVTHEAIIEAAERHGITGRPLNFVRSFLQDRTFPRSPPTRLPDRGPTRRDRSLLLCLWIGCCWTAARSFRLGRTDSAACTQCGADETLEHLLCFCPALNQNRATMVAQLHRMGLPSTSSTGLFFPACSSSRVFKVLLCCLADSMLADRL
ncbi:hypothetical protein HPB49_021062 [Dermacentor silvarum]|uniref:Uncharacterized protein n=1 Tax=Dermacentor silvarum TaxID=543639 RepID=A0ACB8C5E3_DERSI|nr:hypothetical protein HPB49_021062 [Dermacentor silvarum]